MNAVSLIDELRRQGIELSAHGDKLRARGRLEALTPALRRAIEDEKDALLTWLQQHGAREERSLHGLFEEQARRTPDRVAGSPPSTAGKMPDATAAGNLRMHCPSADLQILADIAY